MKRLWKHIPPCLSDVLGFQAIMTQTDGLGIIDDPGGYKPLETMGVGDAAKMGMGRPGGRPDRALMAGEGEKRFPQEGRPDGNRGGRDEGRPDGRSEGRPMHGKGGGPGGHPRKMMPQIVDSSIRNEDIISGTEKKILQAYESRKDKAPSFVLISNAPSSAMISSDIDSAAIRIAQDGTDAGCVRIYGDKDYIYGMSMTFEAIARLLLKEGVKKDNTVNILGCNCVDWSKDTVGSVEKLLNENGISVICKWGSEGMTRERICRSTNAALNIVVNASGLKAAKYMESEFGIPYISAAPFGKNQCEKLVNAAKSILAGDESRAGTIGISKEEPSDVIEAVIIGEQFICNAIRNVLREKGFSGIRVLSFFEMDKGHMEPGDKKIVSEDELTLLTEGPELKLIIANPDYKGAVSSSAKWIDLPNSGMSVITRVANFDMTDEKLDNWIEAML